MENINIYERKAIAYMKIGIDIGGSHIGIGLINSNGTIIAKEEKDLREDIKYIL